MKVSSKINALFFRPYGPSALAPASRGSIAQLIIRFRWIKNPVYANRIQCSWDIAIGLRIQIFPVYSEFKQYISKCEFLLASPLPMCTVDHCFISNLKLSWCFYLWCSQHFQGKYNFSLTLFSEGSNSSPVFKGHFYWGMPASHNLIDQRHEVLCLWSLMIWNKAVFQENDNPALLQTLDNIL